MDQEKLEKLSEQELFDIQIVFPTS